MFHKFSFPLLFVILLYLVECKSDEPLNGRDIHISVVANIGVDEAKTKEEEPYQFSLIYSIDCDDQGNIYVLDGKDVCVKVFDKNGRFIKKTLREGRGPDEIINPYRLAINRFTGNIFILQEYGFQMKEFDVLGRFIKSYTLPQQMSLYFEFIDKDRFLYVSGGRYGEDVYSSLKILNLNTLKIEKEFVPIDDPSLSHAHQRFIIKEGILWTCPADMMKLVGYDVNTGKELKNIPISESYKKCKILKSQYIWRIMFYNFAQPILINNNIYVLVTKLEYRDETVDSFRNPQAKKLLLYRLEKDRLIKIREVSEGEFMDLGAVWQNRIILYRWGDPYPFIKVLEINE